MALDIEGTCNSIQAIVRASTMIRTAPPIAEWPDTVDDADLPLALTRPGAADWEDAAVDVPTRVGKYITDVFVKSNSAGMVYEGIRDALDIISDVGARLMDATNLNGAVFHASLADRGLVMLRMNDIEYRGVTFEIEAEEDV